MAELMKKDLISKTMEALEELPEEKVLQISEFADFLLKKHEDELIQKGIYKITEESESFSFLHEEEDLYTIKDLKKRFK